jgi:hypothetical protein
MPARTGVLLGLVLTTVPFLLVGQPDAPPVFLNHVTIFLPSPVYGEILQSAFLRNEFSAYSEHSNTAQVEGRGTRTYTGIYLRGKHAYLEIFDAAKMQAPARAGQVAFNLSIDNRDQLPLIQQRMAAAVGAAMQIDTVRNVTRNQKSYDVVARADGTGTWSPGIAVSAVVKAYYPDGITREKQFENMYLPDRLLRDIVGITVTVNATELEGLLQTLRACGYAIHREGEEQIATGPEIAFTFLPEKPNAPRILAVDLALSREKTGVLSYKFAGDSEVEFQGSAARWTFKFPGK